MIPQGTTVIDGRGKYLMPGLADMHAHTWEEEDFSLLLANGITTIRNMFGGPTHLRWKERIAAGELASPTIYAAGYDFLKVYTRLSREAYDAVIQEGKARGMSVAGHVPDSVGLSAALRSGIKSIEHLSGYEMLARKEIGPGEEASWARLDESQFVSIARETAKSGTWNCPTLYMEIGRASCRERV